MDTRITQESPLISIVTPVFNEEEVITTFHTTLVNILSALPFAFEIIFVNDGSSDHTLSILHRLQQQDSRIGIVELSRNFGKEIALTAGLDHARGAAIIVIDADLQDPPELIPTLIQEWHNGFDVVYAKRTSRQGESWLKKCTARQFYRLIRQVSKITIPEDTGDFRLLSRKAVNALSQLREQHRFMKGLFAWIGYPQKAVFFERQPRYAGTTKWDYWKLWNFAIEGITSFTTAPLRMATYLGLLTAFGAFVFGSYIIGDTLIRGNPVPGYPSLMVVILFLGGIQLMSIGIIGEYLGRLFDESKQRPLYLVSNYAPARAAGVVTGGQESQQKPRQQGQAAEQTFLLRQVNKRFGAEYAQTLSPLLATITDVEALTAISEWVVVCHSGEELLVRVREQAQRHSS